MTTDEADSPKPYQSTSVAGAEPSDDRELGLPTRIEKTCSLETLARGQTMLVLATSLGMFRTVLRHSAGHAVQPGARQRRAQAAAADLDEMASRVGSAAVPGVILEDPWWSTASRADVRFEGPDVSLVTAALRAAASYLGHQFLPRPGERLRLRFEYVP